MNLCWTGPIPQISWITCAGVDTQLPNFSALLSPHLQLEIVHLMQNPTVGLQHVGTKLFWAGLEEKWPKQGVKVVTNQHHMGTRLFWAQLEFKRPKWSMKMFSNQRHLGTRLFWAQLDEKWPNQSVMVVTNQQHLGQDYSGPDLRRNGQNGV